MNLFEFVANFLPEATQEAISLWADKEGNRYKSRLDARFEEMLLTLAFIVRYIGSAIATAAFNLVSVYNDMDAGEILPMALLLASGMSEEEVLAVDKYKRSYFFLTKEEYPVSPLSAVTIRCDGKEHIRIASNPAIRDMSPDVLAAAAYFLVRKKHQYWQDDVSKQDVASALFKVREADYKATCGHDTSSIGYLLMDKPNYQEGYSRLFIDADYYYQEPNKPTAIAVKRLWELGSEAVPAHVFIDIDALWERFRLG